MRMLWVSCAVVAFQVACGFAPVESSPAGALPVSQDPAAGPDTQCGVPARLTDTRVSVDTGVLEGVRQGEATAWLGVPYAAAPVGALRFRAPVRAGCWSGVRDARVWRDVCAQPGPQGELAGAEDCLFLNVFAPAAEAGQKRPVLVFLHGGDGRTGGTHPADGREGPLDGSALAAAQDAVVVTVEWRLGAFGFLAHPALTAEQEGAANLGLLDVEAALQWVQRNAAAFGADASKVLLFGEAAGAVNVCALTASGLGRGLFSAALMQSGACAAASLSDRAELARALAAQLSCSGEGAAACLRRAPAEALAAALPQGSGVLASWEAGFGPTVDGAVLAEAPLAALEAGRHAGVPLAVGSNADEFALFLPDDALASCAEYPAYLAQVLGALAPQVQQRYPCDDALGAQAAAVTALTDALYACPARRVARAATRGQAPAVYRYLFAQGRAHGPLAPLRAYHSAELPFLFQTLGAEGYAPTPQEERLSVQMQGYWASLARGEAPSARGAPAWPRYQPSQDNALVFDSEVRDEAAAAAFRCDFWDAISR